MSAWLEGHSNDGHDDKLAASLSASPKADTTTNDKQQGPSSSEYLTTSSVPSTVAPPAPLTIPSYYDQQVQLPSMHPIGTPSVATSTDTDSRALSSQSFPFRLQTLARRWAHVIPRDAIIDFASVDDAIAQQYDIVDSLVRKGIDTYSKDHLQATYEISRTAVGEAVFRAATIVSNTLDKAKRKGLAGADDRLAYKEYAELHQQALTYLINRINAFLERFDRVVPNLIRRHMHGKLWPIQQMANINHFVEMAHQPGWVAGSAEHQQQPVEAAHPPHQRHRSPIVLFDVDAISSGTLFLCMAIGFLFLVNAAQVSVQFTIRTVGVSQPTYTALLLTCAWPIYVTAMVLARYRTGRSMAIAPILMARAVILGAIEASAALFIAYSLHAMTLFAYQIVFTACHIAMSTSITGNAWPKERLFSVLLAFVATVLVVVNSLVSPTGSVSSSIVTVTIAIISVAMTAIHRAAKTRLFLSEEEKADLSRTFLESTAVSGLSAFTIVVVVVLIMDTGLQKMSAAFSTVQPEDAPVLVVASMLIALHRAASDFIATQLDSDGSKRSSRSLLMVSFILVILVATLVLQDATAGMMIAAAVLALSALALDVKASTVDWTDHDVAPRVADNVWDAVTSVGEPSAASSSIIVPV
ncbi:SPX domain-containing protein [Plasmodiophora brassicae]|uniref:Uncharacterized protein n=1 Tax=Plasmodiophora brassicae TaxID=37360 RepID=A0A0G4IYW2_PLABS|nr:hypothetical protein PBRA_001506 [Plasmodiophora brassicae]SPQ94045.1 unnamed protein product [Plasmodiophora brassicae]